MTLAEMVRYRRKAMNLTQVELAKRSAVSQATISKIESGEAPDPWFSSVVRIARVLKFNLNLFKQDAA